ncbi:MAG: DUF58 domain-containing protein [Deltaproteobacteria bacterium]|nr:DUF58 domain-containing protein [Deltaproteobacteria bacterium]
MMRLQSRVWRLGLRSERFASAARKAREAVWRVADVRAISRSASPGEAERQTPDARRQTENATPETLFDADFLRKLERLRLIAKRLTFANAKGEHATSRRGFSLEFSDYRRYQHGDDLRYVDWNVYRRLDKLLLKIFTAEAELNVYLLVDTSLSMAQGAPTKLTYAKQVAAALGYIGLKNLDRVGGASFSAALHKPLTLGRGRQQILKLFGFLTRLSCGGETQLRAAVHSFTNLFRQPGFVIIVSDLFDPIGWRAALEELTNKKHQVLTIHIVDPQELSPEAYGDVALRDVENGRERKFFLDDTLIKRYREELERYFGEIEAVCAARHIDYLRTTTDVPFDDFVLQALRRVSSVK